MSEIEKNRLEAFHVNWETIEIILGGSSAIDMPFLNTPTIEKAHEFIKAYGYDPDIQSQNRELLKLRIDALNFIDKQLLADPDQTEPRLKIPQDVQRETDTRKLMVMASTDRDMNGKWACSLLRVMHTLTHINNDLASSFFPAIQKQILDRVLRHTFTDATGDVYLGSDEQGLRLYMLDIKTQKSYDSLVLKLLHKEENTSADIFDRMGFRFVLFNKLESMMALRYLRNKVFAYPNVRTGRSRNTLIDIGRFHHKIDSLRPQVVHGELQGRDLLKKAIEIAESDECKPRIQREKLQDRNVYSSTLYTSIQFTCRQLVRVKGPSMNPKDMETDGGGLVEYRFFFPFEIQILDKNSYSESRRGRASHTEYKRSQLRSARERVFPWLNEENFDR